VMPIRQKYILLSASSRRHPAALATRALSVARAVA
jgi:hypothetical protein